MTTIPELKLRQYLMDLKKKEGLNTGELVEMLDRQKKYLRMVTQDENMG